MMLTQKMDNTFINNLACKFFAMSPYYLAISHLLGFIQFLARFWLAIFESRSELYTLGRIYFRPKPYSGPELQELRPDMT